VKAFYHSALEELYEFDLGLTHGDGAENLGRLPVPSSRGGVAAPVRKSREASEAAQPGWSGTERAVVTDHPVRSIKLGFAPFP